MVDKLYWPTLTERPSAASKTQRQLLPSSLVRKWRFQTGFQYTITSQYTFYVLNKTNIICIIIWVCHHTWNPPNLHDKSITSYTVRVNNIRHFWELDENKSKITIWNFKVHLPWLARYLNSSTETILYDVAGQSLPLRVAQPASQPLWAGESNTRLELSGWFRTTVSYL